jgi:hypothetical protein
VRKESRMLNQKREASVLQWEWEGGAGYTEASLELCSISDRKG